MKNTPYPRWIFEKWCEMAGWEITASEYVKEGMWSKFHGWCVEKLSAIAESILSPFWRYVE